MVDSKALLQSVATGLNVCPNIEAQGRLETLRTALAGVAIKVTVRSDRSADWLVVDLSGAPRVGPIRLEPNRPWPRHRRSRRVLTGDLRFDGRVLVYGASTLIVGAMSADARRLALALLEDGRSFLSVRPRGVRFATVIDPRPDWPRTDEIRKVRRLVADWKVWNPVDDWPARWAAMAVADPDRRVRAICARWFLQFVRTLEVTPAESLVAIAAHVGLPSSLREEATVLLARSGIEGRALAGLVAVEDVAVSQAAARLLAELHPDSSVHLAAAMTGADDVRAALLADRLAAAGDERAVPALVGLLARSNPSLHAAAFHALGATGTPEIAPFLCAEVHRRGPGPDRVAAEAALVRLRKRFEGSPLWDALAGALSLAEGDAGWVSKVSKG